jgi:toxin-antitoxin system PIN domain toxin
VIDLPDINVWLALVDKRHVHHLAASQYWQKDAAETLAFCRVTMLGFLRLSTQARVMPNPLSTNEAWAVYRQFLALPTGSFLTEPTGLDDHFFALSSARTFSHRLWTDAYLAAFALTANCRLVSFDYDFQRYTGLNFLHLPPLPPS